MPHEQRHVSGGGQGREKDFRRRSSPVGHHELRGEGQRREQLSPRSFRRGSGRHGSGSGIRRGHAAAGITTAAGRRRLAKLARGRRKADQMRQHQGEAEENGDERLHATGETAKLER